MNNETNPILDACTCDNCSCHSYHLTQTEENEWLCEDCKEKYTCHICSAITCDSTMNLFDDELVPICPDCNNPQDVDMVQFATNYFGY